MAVGERDLTRDSADHLAGEGHVTGEIPDAVGQRRLVLDRARGAGAEAVTGVCVGALEEADIVDGEVRWVSPGVAEAVTSKPWA